DGLSKNARPFRRKIPVAAREAQPNWDFQAANADNLAATTQLPESGFESAMCDVAQHRIQLLLLRELAGTQAIGSAEPSDFGWLAHFPHLSQSASRHIVGPASFIPFRSSHMRITAENAGARHRA